MPIINKQAKIFEAGTYPDKNIIVTESDLDNFVSNFQGAEVNIEHISTAFDGVMGYLSEIWREGKTLFGRLKFPDYVWELISKADAKKLSVEIPFDKSTISGIALVKCPRVADAAIFANGNLEFFNDNNIIFTELSMESIRYKIEDALWDKFSVWAYIVDTYNDSVVAGINGKFYKYNYVANETTVTISGGNEQISNWADVSEENSDKTYIIEETINYNDGGGNVMPQGNGGQTTDFSAVISNLQGEVTGLREENNQFRDIIFNSHVETTIDKFRKQGIIVPANVKFARDIIKAGMFSSVKFDDETTNFANLFIKFLEATPKVVEFKEVVENGGTDGEEESSDLVKFCASNNVDKDSIEFLMKKFSMTMEEAVENYKETHKDEELVD